jgi:toxin ParE1/3/4
MFLLGYSYRFLPSSVQTPSIGATQTRHSLLTLRVIKVHDLANQEIHSVINHYIDLQAAKAGSEFLVAIEKAYNFIGRFSDAGSRRLGIAMRLPELRTWSLTKFPYLFIHLYV